MRIALMQFKNDNRDPAERRRDLEELIVTAALRGADFIVTPELSISGYIPNRSIWSRAEAQDGPSVTWARELARKSRVHIGLGVLEKADKDFYDAYFIVDPNGRISGWYRKRRAETYVFASHDNVPWIDTPLGRVGIGICADNHFASHLQALKEASVDLVIMPHASPSPAGTSRLVDEHDVDRAAKLPGELAALFATNLGVPVALVNAVGELPWMEGILGRMIRKFILAGRSCLAAADGTLVAMMQAEEGFLIVDTGKKGQPGEAAVKTFDGDWLHAGSPLMRRIIMPFDAKRGARFYQRWTHTA